MSRKEHEQSSLEERCTSVAALRASRQKQSPSASSLRCGIKGEDSTGRGILKSCRRRDAPQGLQAAPTAPQPFFLRIADITIALVSEDPELKTEVDEPAQRFLVTEADPDVVVKARWSNLSEGSGGEQIFDSGGLWQLHSEGGSYRFSFISAVLGSVPYKIARFDQEFTSGKVFFHHPYFPLGRPLCPLEYPLDELLMVNLLAQGKGVEVHACGVVGSSGNGRLFVGQSGAGKTTIARLLQQDTGATILSDDRIILRQADNGIVMYGTPWHGEGMLASPSRAPLTAVYFLEKGQENELVVQERSDSISRLFTCSFPPFYNRDALGFTLTFLEDVVKTVPCYELRFKPEKHVVEFILSKE
jgi:hypothetical protein